MWLKYILFWKILGFTTVSKGKIIVTTQVTQHGLKHGISTKFYNPSAKADGTFADTLPSALADGA